VRDVHRLLERSFPGRGTAELTPVRRGNRKATAIARFPDGPALVVQVSDSPAALGTEVALARRIRERTAVPVPAVLATDQSGGRGYVVWERAPGVDLHEQFVSLSKRAQGRVATTFGQYLAELHAAFGFDAYGPVSADCHDGRETLCATGPTDWSTWFRAYAERGVMALPDAFDPVRDRLLDVAESGELAEGPPSRLFPWDLRPGNALAVDGRVSAVVDWSDPLAAAPGLSVAKTEYLVADWYVPDGSRLRKAFRAGYERVRPLPPVRRTERLAAVVHSAVDSRGVVTRPRYPEVDEAAAVEFHLDALERLL
jgi:Ser/Thr protein kinase RdoA (MazF antagonist)